MEVEIGRGKKGRRAYGFDDIAIVPSQAHARPGRHRHHLDARALPLRAAAARLGDGRRGLPGHRGRDRQARRAGASSTSRGSGPATRTRTRSSSGSPGSRKELATAEMQRDLLASRSSAELVAQRIREIKDQGVVACASLTPQQVREYYETAHRGGPRHPRDPGHGDLGRARVHAQRAAEPEGVHPRGAGPGRGRRLRLLRHRAAPDAHRRGGRARGRRPRRRVHHARGARHRRAAGHRDRGRRGGALAAHARDGRVREGHRRRRHAQRRRRLEGDRLRGGRRDGRARRSRAPTRRRATATTGAWPPSIRRSRAAPA